jgi:hypothetical protein
MGGDGLMRYYAQYNESNTLIAIGTGMGGIEITKSEYNCLLTEICTKADLVDSLYNGEITIADVPTEWQEEIQHRVNKRSELETVVEEQPIT